ncbi:putative WW domain-containing protein [Helianthus annuus]|uniref:WW domain-containing protein n=1 Tax=Helianthus annuus TaxID=4232 RepID=A0A9K3NZK3_HELAN|nr:putative WW domain-containing protein [Helianthus annuus]KAJ0605342.1 putative WW domain-containing protein [Helianthus annuus]KAJ0619358.1 putative WW domain-containing protein [Helianthus annuus]
MFIRFFSRFGRVDDVYIFRNGKNHSRVDQGQLQEPNCGGQTSFSQGFPLQPMLGFSGLLPLQQAHTYAQTAMMNQYHLPAQQHMMHPLHQSASYQSSQQACSQLQQQLQLMQSSNPNLTPQQQSTLAGSVPQTSATFGYPTIKPVTDSLYAASVAPVVFSSGGPVKCNWTEHISLDGYRYYYNSMTGESKVNIVTFCIIYYVFLVNLKSVVNIYYKSGGYSGRDQRSWHCLN